MILLNISSLPTSCRRTRGRSSYIYPWNRIMGTCCCFHYCCAFVDYPLRLAVSCTSVSSNYITFTSEPQETVTLSNLQQKVNKVSGITPRVPKGIDAGVGETSHLRTRGEREGECLIIMKRYLKYSAKYFIWVPFFQLVSVVSPSRATRPSSALMPVYRKGSASRYF